MSGNDAAQRDDTADRFADDPAFAVHEGGKISVTPTRSIDSIADLALTYTPGVARVSSAIAAEPELARRFTWAPRVVAVVSDGDRKSTRLNSSHANISYAVFCLKKQKTQLSLK